MERKYLSISSISMLGSCETKFLDTIMGKQKVTKAMNVGKVAHEKVAESLPKIEKDEIIKQIKAGKPIQVRELPVYDDKMHICGRIDQLAMTGFMEGGKNTGIVIDDKYPSGSRIYGLTLYYKLQLTSYAQAIMNSDTYGSICKIVGAQLRYRQKGSNMIISQHDINSDTLDTCFRNLDLAVNDAWNLYRGKSKPDHRRLDIGRGEWVGCFCGPNYVPKQQGLKT